MTELADLTLAEASAGIHSKSISPLEYTQALLGHIDDHDAKFNAFLRQTPEMALEHDKHAETDMIRPPR